VKKSVEELILSVFESYKNNEPITPHTEANIRTVERMLKTDNTDVYCENTYCVYQNERKCRLSALKKNECLSIDDGGQCLSFSDDENDLD
jgi:hypothetical protein